MGFLNFIATVILIILFCNYSDDDLAKELHDGGVSSDEIGDLLDLSEEKVDEIVGENDDNNNGFYE